MLEQYASQKQFIKQNALAIAILIFSTVFALWQHSTGYSWDFSAYAVNARADGAVFEWTRPPLASAIMFVLGGSLPAEYLYIIFVSVLFFYSSFVLAKKFNINFIHYYAFVMSFFTIVNAFNVGTELLSLALLQLMIAYINNKSTTKHSILSGVCFGLSLLARYTNIAFVVLFIFQRKTKKIILSLIATFLAIAPWLAFNYFAMGDPFFSVAESYALNIKYRLAIQPFNVFDVLLVMNFALPFFILGVVKFKKQLFKDREKMLMFVLFILALAFYIRTPLKEPRYMLAIIIPGSYFAALFLVKYRRFIYLIAALNIAVVLLILPSTQLGSPSPYLNFINNENSLWMDAKGVNHSCSIRSNAWVALGYYGVPSDAYPWQDAVPHALEEGYTIVLFKYNPEPLYLYNKSFVDKYKTIETPQYVVFSGNNCKPASRRVDVSYFKIRGEGMFFENGTIFDKRSCAIFVSSDFCAAIGWKND